MPLLWRHNERDSVSNHQRLHCLLKRLFRRRSKIISKLRVTGLCAWNSPGTGEFPAQKASNAENVSIWWRHHGIRTPNNSLFSHIDAWTKWLEFCRRRFGMGFINQYWFNFHWDVFVVVQLPASRHWFSPWTGAEQATSHYLNKCWICFIKHEYIVFFIKSCISNRGDIWHAC